MVPKFSLIVHDVRSILNVGALFRTADAVGVDHIWLTGYTPGPDTHPDKMTKTALGAEQGVAWGRMKRVGDLIKKLKKDGIAIIALEQTKKAIDYRALKPQWPLALIVGNEVEGMPHNVAQSSISVVEIPMRGAKESLNVAVAFSVAAYELTRNW